MTALNLTSSSDRSRLVDEFDNWRQRSVEIEYLGGKSVKGVLLEFDGTRLSWKGSDGKLARARIDELTSIRPIGD